MARQVEVLGLFSTLLNVFVLMYIYLFFCKIWTNVGIDIFENKKLSTLVESPIFPFPKYRQLFKHKVSLEIVLQILKPIILSGIVCLNIFGARVVMYIYLVSPLDGYIYQFCDFRFFFRRFPFLSNFFLLMGFIVLFKKINVKCSKFHSS